MEKIPCIFLKTEDQRKVIDKINPVCQWVFDGEGTPTRKLDGTCCMVRDGKLYKRRMVRKGQETYAHYENCATDENTGKSFGWVPVSFADPSNKYHMEAWERQKEGIPDGTYELVGPKVQGNAECQAYHKLVKHGCLVFGQEIEPNFEFIKQALIDTDMEGIVWHHPDGRMGKIAHRHFGIPRGGKSE